MSKTLFIGDLHLSANRPDVISAFILFLKKQNIDDDIDAMYILGDLFETWAGDDVAPEFTKDVALALKKASLIFPIYYIHGNRDFLIGEKFAKTSGINILDQHVMLELYGVRTLLLHGDTLCTLDTSYQRFRNFRNINIFRKLFLLLPKSIRRNMVAKIRSNSEQNKQNLKKTYAATDVVQNEILRLFTTLNIQLMIHGHTHQQKIHSLDDNQRIVLGDWDRTTSILVITPNKIYFENQTI